MDERNKALACVVLAAKLAAGNPSYRSLLEDDVAHCREIGIPEHEINAACGNTSQETRP